MVADANTHGCQVYEQLAEVICRPPTFEYHGQFTHACVGDCADKIVEKIRTGGCCDGVARRAYKVVIELLENVQRHSVEVENCDPPLPQLLVWRESDHSVVIAVRNAIARDDITQFDAWLKHVQDLELTQVKEAIRHAMLSPSRSLRGGAGIGLLTMRQLSQTFEWEFSSKRNGLEQFTIVVRIV